MIFAGVELKVMCSSNKESLGDMSGLPYYIAGGCFSDLPDEDGSGRAESALCYIFFKKYLHSAAECGIITVAFVGESLGDKCTGKG